MKNTYFVNAVYYLFIVLGMLSAVLAADYDYLSFVDNTFNGTGSFVVKFEYSGSSSSPFVYVATSTCSSTEPSTDGFLSSLAVDGTLTIPGSSLSNHVNPNEEFVVCFYESGNLHQYPASGTFTLNTDQFTYGFDPSTGGIMPFWKGTMNVGATLEIMMDSMTTWDTDEFTVSGSTTYSHTVTESDVPGDTMITIPNVWYAIETVVSSNSNIRIDNPLEAAGFAHSTTSYHYQERVNKMKIDPFSKTNFFDRVMNGDTFTVNLECSHSKSTGKCYLKAATTGANSVTCDASGSSCSVYIVDYDNLPTFTLTSYDSYLAENDVDPSRITTQEFIKVNLTNDGNRIHSHKYIFTPSPILIDHIGDPYPEVSIYTYFAFGISTNLFLSDMNAYDGDYTFSNITPIDINGNVLDSSCLTLSTDTTSLSSDETLLLTTDSFIGPFATISITPSASCFSDASTTIEMAGVTAVISNDSVSYSGAAYFSEPVTFSKKSSIMFPYTGEAKSMSLASGSTLTSASVTISGWELDNSVFSSDSFTFSYGSTMAEALYYTSRDGNRYEFNPSSVKSGNTYVIPNVYFPEDGTYIGVVTAVNDDDETVCMIRAVITVNTSETAITVSAHEWTGEQDSPQLKVTYSDTTVEPPVYVRFGDIMDILLEGDLSGGVVTYEVPGFTGKDIEFLDLAGNTITTKSFHPASLSPMLIDMESNGEGTIGVFPFYIAGGYDPGMVLYLASFKADEEHRTASLLIIDHDQDCPSTKSDSSGTVVEDATFTWDEGHYQVPTEVFSVKGLTAGTTYNVCVCIGDDSCVFHGGFRVPTESKITSASLSNLTYDASSPDTSYYLTVESDTLFSLNGDDDYTFFGGYLESTSATECSTDRADYDTFVLSSDGSSSPHTYTLYTNDYPSGSYYLCIRQGNGKNLFYNTTPIEISSISCSVDGGAGTAPTMTINGLTGWYARFKFTDTDSRNAYYSDGYGFTSLSGSLAFEDMECNTATEADSKWTYLAIGNPDFTIELYDSSSYATAVNNVDVSRFCPTIADQLIEKTNSYFTADETYLDTDKFTANNSYVVIQDAANAQTETVIDLPQFSEEFIDMAQSSGSAPYYLKRTCSVADDDSAYYDCELSYTAATSISEVSVQTVTSPSCSGNQCTIQSSSSTDVAADFGVVSAEITVKSSGDAVPLSEFSNELVINNGIYSSYYLTTVTLELYSSEYKVHVYSSVTNHISTLEFSVDRELDDGDTITISSLSITGDTDSNLELSGTSVELTASNPVDTITLTNNSTDDAVTVTGISGTVSASAVRFNDCTGTLSFNAPTTIAAYDSTKVNPGGGGGSPAPSSTDPDGLPGWAIFLIVVVVVGAIVTLLYFLQKKKKIFDPLMATGFMQAIVRWLKSVGAWFVKMKNKIFKKNDNGNTPTKGKNNAASKNKKPKGNVPSKNKKPAKTDTKKNARGGKKKKNVRVEEMV